MWHSRALHEKLSRVYMIDLGFLTIYLFYSLRPEKFDTDVLLLVP